MFIAGSPALAQSNSQGGLEEIVVTAQKREQSVQDVPISVTAITADSLNINRVQSVKDLDSISPALTVTTVPAGNAGPIYSMRGVVALGTAPGADKGVALYIDGVYIGSASGSAFGLADIERIEVLKGPQGTLFGRNSTGGAVSITTRGPRGEFHLQQRASYGNYDRFESRTRVDTPQIGPFSAALTYSHSERRGEIRNLGGGTVWDGSAAGLSSRLVAADWLGSDNTESFAASLKADLTPDLDLVYKFDHTDERFTEQGVGQIAPHPLASINALNAASGYPLFVSETRPKAVNNWATVPSHLKATGHVLTATWQATDSLRLKNIASYRKSSYFAPLNDLYGTGGLYAAPDTPFFTVVSLSAGRDKQWLDELQLDYDSSLLHLTSGGIYYKQKNAKGAAGTGYNGIAFRTVPDFVLPAPAEPTKPSEVTVTSWALYAQGEVHILDSLDFIAGARYTDDRKRGIDRSTPAGGDLNYDGTQWTYNVGVNYRPVSDVLLYAKYSTGYISGGKLATLAYNPEMAKSWEAGLKADWLDRRLRTNIAVYSVKYEAMQIAAPGLAFGVPLAPQVLVNAGDGRAKGFELELTAAPVQHITLGANLSYMDFKYTSLDPRFEASGQTVAAQRPKWTANLSGEFKAPLEGDTSVSWRVDANYRSAHPGTAYTDPVLQAEGRIPASWVVNSAFSIEDIAIANNVNAKISLWVKNLFDQSSARYMLVAPFSATATYERARTYGIDLTLDL
jgi:iron complex outermembrane receptor protein